MLNLRALLTTSVAVVVCAQSTGGVTSPAAKMHAIIELRQQCLIGATENGQWVPANKIGRALEGAQKFTLYTLRGPAGEVTADIGQESSPLRENACEEPWDAKSLSPEGSGVAITSPDWNPLPRVPRAIDVRDTTYVKVVGQILRAAGLRNPEVKIIEGYKIDLDGDGKEEVVIVASRYKQGLSELTGIGRGTSPGDYSLVFVRKIVGGRVRDIFVVKDVRLRENDGGLPRGYHLSAIADLNGDGVMELALYSAYFEGSSTDFIEVKGDKATGVLSCGCEH